MQSSWLTEAEIETCGFARLGQDVRISTHALWFQPQFISIGSHVRIDAFCILSAGSKGIEIGDHVHLSAGAYFYGGGGLLRLDDFVCVSGKASVYTANDDYAHGWLTGPTVPEEFRHVASGDVIVEKHGLIGAGTILLPGVTLGEGCSVGALSLIRKSIPAYQIVVGNPQRVVGERCRDRLSALERDLRKQEWELRS